MELGLKDKVALITGAGSQVGFAKGIALTLAKEGCDIIATDIDLKGAEQTAAEVKALGRKAIALKADVTNNAEVEDMVKAALKEFSKIDILVNAAGGSTPPQAFAETSEAKWDKDLDLNLKGMLYCTRAVLPQMISRKSGRIVNFSSTAGLSSGQPSGTIYGAAKAAVSTFTAGLAQEVADSGINANSIAPGLGATAFHSDWPGEWRERVKKMAEAGMTITPQDIGNTIAFLCSDVSRRVTGQCIVIAGPMSGGGPAPGAGPMPGR
jgi:3-oxoacyl-[acyl-carrier protein] reductase